MGLHTENLFSPDTLFPKGMFLKLWISLGSLSRFPTVIVVFPERTPRSGRVTRGAGRSSRSRERGRTAGICSNIKGTHNGWNVYV